MMMERLQLRLPAGAFGWVQLEARPGGFLVGWNTGGRGVGSMATCLTDFQVPRPTRFVALDVAITAMGNWWKSRDPLVAGALEVFDLEDLILCKEKQDAEYHTTRRRRSAALG